MFDSIVDKFEYDGSEFGDVDWVLKLDTITNSQGKIEWVGTYVYN